MLRETPGCALSGMIPLPCVSIIWTVLLSTLLASIAGSCRSPSSRMSSTAVVCRRNRELVV